MGPHAAATVRGPYVRPGFVMTRIVNPILTTLGLTTVLIVRGRRTGRILSVPLGAPFVFEGRRYLVSGRGDTDWSRNVRAAGRCEVRTRGKTEAFDAVELDGSQREQVLAAYRAALGERVRALFARMPDAADHPVFRLDLRA